MLGQRGVDVSILIPGEHADKRFVQIAGESSYTSLLEPGVHIRPYGFSSMHAKANQRSTRFDEETNVVIFDADVVGVLDRHLDDDHRHSTPLDPTDWAERGLVQRAAEKVTDVVSGWP